MHFQTGLNNPLDAAIQAYVRQVEPDISAAAKMGDIPYYFVRKRLSVVVADPQGMCTLITKGALDNVLSICLASESEDGAQPLDAPARAEIEQQYSAWSAEGFRVLGVATKQIDRRVAAYTREDENGLIFAGFLLFFDRPKLMSSK